MAIEEWSNSEASLSEVEVTGTGPGTVADEFTAVADESTAVAKHAATEFAADVHADVAEESDSQSYVVFHLGLFLIIIVGFPEFKAAIPVILMNL